MAQRSPTDGVVARRQIAQVLVASLASQAGKGKTFELVAENGAATEDFNGLFAALRADPRGSLDGVGDVGNMPLEREPLRVQEDLQRRAGNRFTHGPALGTFK